jgi:hypothetical protein
MSELTPEQKAAIIVARAAVLNTRVAALQAEAETQRFEGRFVTVSSADFIRLINESGCMDADVRALLMTGRWV